jgi:hypothetical protein
MVEVSGDTEQVSFFRLTISRSVVTKLSRAEDPYVPLHGVTKYTGRQLDLCNKCAQERLPMSVLK